jgi:1,4-dihydroxy-2-naphthoate octaprenyltransferase
MPVYLFALSQADQVNLYKAIMVFVILHLLVYPASNGYNSYMDRDTQPVGGIKNPMQPTRQLYHATILLDSLALLLSMTISIHFTIGILLYIIASKAYSYRGIRLKKYPFVGYLTVVTFQGALTYFLVYAGVQNNAGPVDMKAMLAAALLIGGFYPLTQIYQHEADLKDDVITISYRLGYKGTFIFTAIVYSLALVILYLYFDDHGESLNFFLFLAVMLPVLIFFNYWAYRVWRNEGEANFDNTMRMNILASICTNLAFLIILMRRLL